jgi:hypothetical protein
MSRRTARVVALAGVVLVAFALAVIWLARVTVPRDLYVSELGADGMPTEHWFMAALVAIVAGSALIGVAARDIRSRVAVLRWWRPSVSLWVSGGFFLLASQVTCTAGCPIPYGPSFTWPDFVHTTSAVIAFAAACWAMLQCSFAVGHPALARFSLIAAVAVAVIAAAGGLMSLARWQVGLGSRLEFVATTIGLAWIGVLGVALAFARPVAAGGGGSAPHGDEKVFGEAHEARDLGVVAVDPAALGLVGDRHELVVALPDDEGALGAEHVLLPPDLPQVRPGDAAPA